MRIEWTPPFTPHDLLQEQYWPDRWKVAVICMFLNCTRRSTAEPIVRQFFDLHPTPEEYCCHYMDENERTNIEDQIGPLGFRSRRAERIFKFSLDFLAEVPIKECHGIGDYAEACDRMFFDMDFDDSPPDDGVLANVWRWVVQENGRSHPNPRPSRTDYVDVERYVDV